MQLPGQRISAAQLTLARLNKKTMKSLWMAKYNFSIWRYVRENIIGWLVHIMFISDLFC